MKKILLLACVMLGMANGAFADDAFSVANISLPQNAEVDVAVNFSLDEGSTCSGYNFWLQVPEQLAFVTYEKNEKTYVTYTAGDCYEETPTITPNIHEGYLKVGCLTANSDPIIGQTGTLVTFRLKVVGTVNVGDVLEGKLLQGTISAENGSVHNVADASFTVTIGAPADTRVVLDETSTTAPSAATGVDVRVKRTIKANEWGTLCLPFAMTAAQVKAAFGEDVELLDFTGYDVTEEADEIVGIEVSFAPLSAIEANHPCLIRVSSPVSEFTVDGVDIDPEDEPVVATVKRTRKAWSELIGTYVAQTEVPEKTLFLSGGDFWYSAGNTKMKAFRAYFDFFDVLTEVDESYANIRFCIGGETTGINAVGTDAQRTGGWYTLDGRKLDRKPTERGVYIVNRKKVSIR